MRLVCIADTHGHHEILTSGHFPGILPSGDALIIAGDAGLLTIGCVEVFNQWLSTLPHKVKIFVAGNHDRTFQDSPDQARAALNDALYLQDSGATVQGISFWGSPWTYPSKKQNLHGSFIANYSIPIPRVPATVQVLVTHAPDPPCFPRRSWSNCNSRLVLHIHGHFGRSEYRRAASDRLGAFPHSLYASLYTSRFRRLYQLPEPPIVVDLDGTGKIVSVAANNTPVEVTRYIHYRTTVRLPAFKAKTRAETEAEHSRRYAKVMAKLEGEA